MFKQFKIVLLSFILLLPAYAEEVQNTPQITHKKALDPAYVNAMEKFFNSMNLKENYGKIIDASTDALIKTNPTLIKAKKELRAFYEKYIGWENIKLDMMRIYAQHYSISELEDITNFYQTDTGQKTLKLLPVTYKEGQELGMRLIMEHVDELKAIIQKTTSAPSTETKK